MYTYLLHHYLFLCRLLKIFFIALLLQNGHYLYQACVATESCTIKATSTIVGGRPSTSRAGNARPIAKLDAPAQSLLWKGKLLKQVLTTTLRIYKMGIFYTACKECVGFYFFFNEIKLNFILFSIILIHNSVQ